ncbi:oxidoreductase [Perilla frutescens var. hirtella]|uniref:Oxidoreductase n=1 Tax=Perilla frutescens var. hirtella TaxID=608512 RepID=A0AAD4IUY5_PERFH|nr:oxidoreductase [Perilla frutescens var. hirtella]
MPPAAGVASAQGDRTALKPMVVPAVVQQPQLPMMTAASEAFAKDAIIAWFRGEFAAANAIIDALCSHLTQLENGDAAAYESTFAAIHRRRMNWIPILQMQKYFSIADVAVELKKVAEKKRSENEVEAKKIEEIADGGCTVSIDEKEKHKEKNLERALASNENGGGEVVDEDFSSEITDTGSQEVQPFSEHVELCSNHEQCEARRAQIKMTKGFVAKEPVKGHMVNVVRGLKLYEDIFTDTELSKLNDFVNELRVAGQNGELSGETFILYNQQTKGNKRELIQLGVPIFGQVKEDDMHTFQKSYIEPIPALLQGVIEHLIQWRLLPENRKPNSCIINFFDEGEYSQPFLKPPHLEQPLSTLLLSESTMAFGRMLVSDGEGNYRGPLMLSLKEGSLLVMRGNSSDTARHVMCSSLNKRVSVTFFRVRAEIESNTSEITTSSKAMSLWQPGVTMPNNYGAVNMMPKWGLLRAPVVMLAPMRPMIVNTRKIPRGGTGVFLPWNAGSRRHAKHLPPRAQRGRFLALPPPADNNKSEN